MTKAANRWFELGLNLIVALGVAVGLTVVAVFVFVQYEAATWNRQLYKGIVLTPEGEPVLVGGDQYERIVTTMGGERLEIPANDLSYPVYIPTHQVVNDPLWGDSWSVRLASTTAGSSVHWYLVHDGGRPGKAYGVGYDVRTKGVQGYFSRSGFVDQLPSATDWFNVPSKMGLSGSVVQTSDREPFAQTRQPIRLLADNRLWVIDGTKREVRSILEVAEPAVLGTIWQFDRSRPIASRVAVRTATRVIVSADDGSKQFEIPIPTDLQRDSISISRKPDGQVVIVSHVSSSPNGEQLAIWLDAAGHEQRRASVPTTTLRTQDHTASNLLSLSCLPSFAGQWALVLIGSQAFDRAHAAPVSRWAAFGTMLGAFWPALLATFVIGLICALLTYRRQQRFALPGTALWTAFVFLLGLPGWVAYRWHRDWPPLGQCAECHQAAPRDRSRCTQCGARFPAPKPLGTEVFA